MNNRSVLSYALVINGGAYGSQASRSALLFANAVIQAGHKISRVFFYQDGVLNGSALTVPANDEINIVERWQAFAKDNDIALETCVAAALRRGIVSSEEAKLHQLTSHNLASGFVQSGLGALAEAMLTQDRVVQF
ncbi:sulfurtransferase complex subunit TusD [Vibrio palustris]|uniref:Sulfurtransferase TusD homolog n=1 Tax=Vibrio palustris TaxID=1918946 RepID=A0A1R4B8F6_9VIBR|nr:sulfurtransferase complex subunit TusD [Vibrio palustris]SJL85202.1 Sulfurtransferase TusD [Vibrio palustris]